MSKISLTGNASGSGTVIIQGPNSSTDRNLTVSEASGNIAISDGSTLTVDYASNRTTIGGKADFYGASTVKTDKWNIIGSNTTLSVGQNYFANTRAQANLQLTLPLSANIGDTIMVQDQEGFASSNNVVVLRNGHNIDGVERNAVLTVDNSGVTLVYESARNGWVTVKHTPKDLNNIFQGSVSGYTAGGYSNIIQKFPFAIDSNSSDVGDLTQSRGNGGGNSSETHGYMTGGNAPPQVNTVDRFPFATDANATDAGDLSSGRRGHSSQSSTSFGYNAGGFVPAFVNTIDKFPFAVASFGTATDVGDLGASGQYTAAGQSSSTFGYNSGGEPGGGGDLAIQRFPFATDTNVTNVGNLTQERKNVDGQSSSESGYTSGGNSPPVFRNTIDKFPFASEADATDVGDMTSLRRGIAGSSSIVSGYICAGEEPPGAISTNIEKFPFASDNNATSIGDLLSAQDRQSGQLQN